MIAICDEGEEWRGDSQECRPCERGTYTFYAGGECQPCPEFGLCEGKNIIRTDPGFWRSHNLSKNIFECLILESCPGGTDAGICNEGYGGPLCNKCLGHVDGDYWSRSGKYHCQ